MSFRVVAIDGPSGAGKGTVARAVAQELGYIYVDTGAMYRAVSWKAKRIGLALDDEDSVSELAKKSELKFDGSKVIIDGQDVTKAIRTPEIDRAAAMVACLPKVRAVLVARQRIYASQGSIIMEGRDIGTKVFPDADVKIYLDAHPEERARRRAVDPSHRLGEKAQVEDITSELKARDLLDRTREVSPLTRAYDAELVDTTGASINEVILRVIQIVRKKLQT